MAVELVALCVDAQDPQGLARFWAGLLGWDVAEEDGTGLRPTDDTGFGLRFLPAAAPKRAKNAAHLDLTSASPEQQQETVARALALGGRHVDVGQRPEEGQVVLADPEGNELCVIEAGNGFLADCGFVGALACDGTAEVGRFWSAALGWPLVWDSDGETATAPRTAGPRSPGAARRPRRRRRRSGCTCTSRHPRAATCAPRSTGSPRSGRRGSATGGTAGWS